MRKDQRSRGDGVRVTGKLGFWAHARRKKCHRVSDARMMQHALRHRARSRRRACLAIQQTWPAAERRKRAAWAFQWEPVELTVAPYPGADPLRFEGAPSGVL